MKTANQLYNKGVYLTFIASIVWALGYFLRKLILNDISPILLTFYTSIIVSLTIWKLFHINMRHAWQVFCVAPFKFISLSMSGVAIGSTLMFVALSRIDLGVTTLIEKTQPIFVLFLASIFLNEHIRKTIIPYVFMALIGSYMISFPDPFALTISHVDFIGISCAFGAAFSWAISGVIGKHLVVNAQPQEIVFLRFFLASIVLAPLLIFQNDLGLAFKPSWFVISLIFITAIGSTTFGYLLHYNGLKTIHANVSAFIQLSTPVTSVILGITFLNEALTLYQTIGAILLLGSIYKIILIQRGSLS